MPHEDTPRRESGQTYGPVTPEQIKSIRSHIGTDAEIRPIPWAPGYAGSSDGFIISVRRWKCEPTVPFRVLKTMRHSNGYPQVNIQVNYRGRVRTVHTLIAELFLGPKPFDAAEVRHKDGNPENNAVGNLEWGTHTQNMADKELHGTVARGERNGHAKITAIDAGRVRRLFHHGIPSKVIADVYGLSVSTVSEIGRDEIWSHSE